MASAGSDIFSLIPKLNILIVGCVDGFCFISTQNLKIVKNIRCTYSVTSLECSSNNSFVCCCSDKNENKIRQYIIDDFTFSIKKSSEKKCHSYEIWNLKDWVTTLEKSPVMFIFQLLKWAGYLLLTF